MKPGLKKIGFWRQVGDAADISSSIHVSSSDRPSAKNNNPSSPRMVDLLAVEAAEETKDGFLSTMPPSLLGRDSYANADEPQHRVVAPFKREELILGPKLGSGEFSHCYEISSFRLKKADDDAQDENKSKEELNMRLQMKQSEKYRDSNNARYAVKHLKPEYLEKNGPDEYVYAACDLAREAEFLASLNHPNIIKLRGITYSNVAGFADGPTGYFLVLDRLQETLDNRIKKWRIRYNAQSRGISRSVSTKVKTTKKFFRKMSSFTHGDSDDEEGVEMGLKQTLQEMLDERLFIALQISAALLYLHSHTIIFRDLKPANIGFDVRGDVKIFDFGLSRFMPGQGDIYNDLYEMSGAGSPRYMAPECLMGEPYNLKADTWTFALVVWEILTLKVPFSSAKSRAHLVDMVVQEKPELNRDWPSKIQGMLDSSLDTDPDMRPKMKLWYNTVRDVLVDLRSGNTEGLSDTYVLRHRTLQSMKEMLKGIDKEALYREGESSTHSTQ